MATNKALKSKMAALSSYLSSFPRSTIIRYDLRQEPDAVVPLVRIREGGGLRGPSLPRPLADLAAIRHTMTLLLTGLKSEKRLARESIYLVLTSLPTEVSLPHAASRKNSLKP